MPIEPGSTLVVGVTGRALAQSAARGGHRVVVLDYFADRDTCATAAACRAVVSPRALRFDGPRLLREAALLAPGADMVYGSGFEGRVPLLERLAAGRRLRGNPTTALSSVRDPAQLFPLLHRLGIRSPEVQSGAPPDPTGWLTKHPGGAGGTRVRHADRRRYPAGTYYQRFLPGRVCSALFLADGHRPFIIGFNEQWTTSARPGLPFLYGGAVSRVPLPPGIAADLTDRIDALVAATGLIGLNGVDFLLHDETWWLLEINPRPTATMELYDPDYPRGLFDAHLLACAGELPRVAASGGAARAAAIVHASAPWRTGERFQFPSWCRDLPQPGVAFAVGDPVCTVQAEAATPAAAVELVHDRRRGVERLLLDESATAVGA